MRVHVFQHVSFEDIGNIRNWLEKNKASIKYTRFYISPKLPRITDIDFLIIMGGPMSVNEEEKYPWFIQEKAFIKQTIESGTPVLGICLGAQLIASAMGKPVFQGKYNEIGWFPIEAATTNNTNNTFRFPDNLYVFHWHGETFDLPPNTVHLARSVGCENQAFQLSSHVIGLQFHLEMETENIESMLKNCCKELVKGKFIQNKQTIQSLSASASKKTNIVMEQILEYLTGHKKTFDG